MLLGGLIAPTSPAHAQSVTAPSSINGNPDSFETISGVSVINLMGTIRVTVSVDTGNVQITTTSSLSAPQGYTTADWTSGTADEISFEGSLTNVNNALGALAYRGFGGTLTTTASTAGAAYYAGTGRFYEYVASGDIDWDDARDDAADRTLNGESGYLATITSEGEMDFIVEKIGGSSPAWISGDDADTEGEWRYSSGPEDGDQFWQGTSSGSTVNSAFEDWCAGEPNNSGGEDYLQITFDTIGGEVSDGCWNDLPNSGASNAQYNPVGYVTEYAAASALVATTTIIDVAPTVLSVTRNTPSGETVNTSTFQSCGTTLVFTVTFSESVSGVDTADFALSGAGSTGMTIQSVSGSGATRTVAVNCPPDANRGAVNLVLAASPSIIDTNSNALTSNTIGSAQGYNLVDDILPILSSVTRNTPSAETVNASSFQSCGATLTFTATFSESVSGVDTGDFALSGAGSTGISVQNVSGSGTTRAVTVSCPQDDATGAVNLVLAASPSISDADTNALTSSVIGSAQGYVLVDDISPTLSAISRSNPSAEIVPSSAYQSCGTTLDFAVSFSEAVSNVGTADFSLSGTGSTGMSVQSVSGSGSGSSYTVTASCPQDDSLGEVALSVLTGPGITDAAGNNLVANTSVTPEGFTLSNRPVLSSVTRLLPSDRVIPIADTQSCLQPRFQADFSKDVRNVSADDFAISGPGGAGVSVDAVAQQSARSYAVSLSCLPADNLGTFTLALAAGNDIEDLSGLALAGTDIATQEDYEISEAPRVLGVLRDNPSEQEIPAQDLSNCVAPRFRVTFSEDVTGVELLDFAISADNADGITTETLQQLSADSYEVGLSCLPQAFRGAVTVEVTASASISDTLGIPLDLANLPASQTYLVTETRVTPVENASVSEVIEATAEAPVVAVEKQLTHIKERLSQQRSAPAGPEPSTPVAPQHPPLTPTRRVEMVATRLNQLTTYFQQTENGNVYFDTNSSQLSTAARIKLAGQAQQLKRYKSAVYKIEGHTDKRGSLFFNRKLGTTRAEAVRSYFIDQGIEAERVQIVSFGEEKPVSGCADESCFKLNRRAQTRLVINEEIQQEIGQEIDVEYGTPISLTNETSRSSCGLIASLSLSNESGTMQDARPVLCGSTEALADSLGYNWGVWTQGLISVGIVQNGNDAPEMDFTGQNLTFGIDYRLPTNTIIGFALGAGQNDLQGDTASKSETEQVVASFYMAQPIGDNWAVNLAGGHVVAQTKSTRIDTENSETLTGQRDGISNFGSVELVYYLRRDNAIIDLSAEYMQMRSRFDAYREDGTNALAFAGQEIDNEAISVGGKWNFIPRDTNTAWRYNLTASAQYDLSDASVAKVNFVNIPAANDYLVVSENDEPLTLSLGGGMNWSNARGDSVNIDYNYQQNAQLSRIHALSVTYRKPF